MLFGGGKGGLGVCVWGVGAFPFQGLDADLCPFEMGGGSKGCGSSVANGRRDTDTRRHIYAYIKI